MTVLDTGAGTNLIRSDCLETEALATVDTSPDIVNLASATKHRLDNLGIVTLTVTVASYTSRQPSVVVKELGTDAILGCTFLDTVVESIHPRKRYALLRNGNRTKLVRQLAIEPRKERRTVCHRVARSKDLTILQVAQRAVLAPYSETVVLSNTGKRGPVLLEVSKMLTAGVIEPATTDWASPVILVAKTDGTLRFCVYYRKLNALTVKDSYPLPRIDEYLETLGDAAIFSTLDCNSGYWQIPVAKADRDKTTFTCHEGCYRFKRMPFGLCNAPATFQRTLEILLAGLRWKSCLVYLDDIIVFYRSIEDHFTHLGEILAILKEAGLSLKLKKCNFFTKTVDYLGHVIRPGKLEVAEKNTAALQGFKEPTTQTQLRSFLGMCNVYRRFVPNFARVAAPLNQLLKKGQGPDLEPFDEAQRGAFELLKQALSEPPVLRLPQKDLPYSVDTDASAYQIGCALMQTYPDGTRHPIGFWSRSLTPAEKNYRTGERECLATLWAVQLLRPYLERTHFDLYTYHIALRWIMNMTDASSRLARWRLRLLEFDFTVQYKKGAKNTIADCISRLPTYGETAVEPDVSIPCLTVEQDTDTYPFLDMDLDDFYDEMLVASVDICDVEEVREISPITNDELVQAQFTDAYCRELRDSLERGEGSPFAENDKGLLVRISPVDRSEQIVVPQSLRAKVLYLNHQPRFAAHPGGDVQCPPHCRG